VVIQQFDVSCMADIRSQGIDYRNGWGAARHSLIVQLGTFKYTNLPPKFLGRLAQRRRSTGRVEGLERQGPALLSVTPRAIGVTRQLLPGVWRLSGISAGLVEHGSRTFRASERQCDKYGDRARGPAPHVRRSRTQDRLYPLSRDSGTNVRFPLAREQATYSLLRVSGLMSRKLPAFQAFTLPGFSTTHTSS
jgi:hypothetical protein